MASQIDKPLKEKYKRNSIEVRKGDEVKVMRGSFKKKIGKVSVVDVKYCRIQIEGINRNKKTGDKVPVWFHPSKVKIITLNDKDERRFGKKKEKKIENKTEKVKNKSGEKNENAN